MMMEETTTHNFYNYNADDRGSRGRGVGHRELQQVQQQQWVNTGSRSDIVGFNIIFMAIPSLLCLELDVKDRL